MSGKENIEEKLREIVMRLNEGRGLPPVGPASDLFEEGYVDSFGFFELLSEVETAFGVKFDEKDLTKENFSRIAAIAKSVEGMLL